MICKWIRKRKIPQKDFPIGFSTSLNIAWLKELVDQGNKKLNDPVFRRKVKAVKEFDMSDHDGRQVLANLLQVRCQVKLYKSKWPWSKAIAYTIGNSIYLNTRKNPRELKSMLNTLIHEAAHCADYSHGNNSSVGKENTVPYKVGSLV